MIIQGVLIVGLLLCLLYAFLQRRKALMVSITISLTSLAGIYFVVFPQQTTEVAKVLGVGRGTDLILYCWIVITLVISINLRFKLLNLQEQLTDVAREIALGAPRAGADGKPVGSKVPANELATAALSTASAETAGAAQLTQPTVRPVIADAGQPAPQALGSADASRRDGQWPLITGLTVFALIIVRTIPLAGPLIWDEGVYVQQAHFGTGFGIKFPEAAFATPPMPNLLFLALYGVVFRFGAQYMEVARILNVACLSLGAVCMFLVARRMLSRRAAFAFAVLGASGAIASYAAMFIPESLYFLGFWLAAFALFHSMERSLVRAALHVGVILGMLMLVKPHAAMLLAACCLYFVAFPIWVKPELKLTTGLAAVFTCAVAFLIAWTLGTIAITGRMELPSVGRYGSIGGIVLSISDLPDTLSKIVFNLSGHFSALLLLFGATFFGLAFRVIREIAGPRTPYDAPKAAAFLAVILSGVMIVFIGKYSAAMTVFGSSEGIDRLHGRYYDFLLPLAALAFLAGWERMRPDGAAARVVFASVGAVSLIAAAFWLFGRFDLSVNDFPEAFMLRSGKLLPAIATAAAITFLAVLSPGKIYLRTLAAFLIFVVAASTAVSWKAQAAIPPFWDNFAAEALRRADPAGDGSRWQVVIARLDTRMPWMAMALRAPVRVDVWSENRALDCTLIQANTTWLLVLDPIQIECGFERVATPDGFSLWRRPRA